MAFTLHTHHSMFNSSRRCCLRTCWHRTGFTASRVVVQRVAPFAGAADAVVCEHHAYGGAGAAKLGEAVVAACKQPVDFKFLYDLKQPIKVRLYHAVSPLHKCCIVKTE